MGVEAVLPLGGVDEGLRSEALAARDLRLEVLRAVFPLRREEEAVAEGME